ncbi:NAD-dependent epimerase/dehydratase family protein [Candidatus Competibacter phosphatis]|uniref:NAD-dependent epimerase/dehydratase family protein n=1 Tax=Candidatus Competibacter phosphatis TaxID=221280 RepID=A0ABX1TL28_9GAMM|nr:NAD-dependent epimerase/dehydratase family protein [Candidatus Competibacter phosphatis]NMQ19397.1 NAD-dependent epimerase/dehydratase family protein [Candidatus Competibacter phosphatis]
MTPVFLVTGAAGFIGSHSVEWLLRHGWRVVGVDNLRTGRLDNLADARSSPNFTLVIADAGDETAMRPLFQQHRFTGMLHLAALVSVPESFREPELNYRLNLATADTLARLCLEFECKRLVFASSAAVYGANAALPNRESALPQPLSPYAAAKLAAEVMLLGYAASYGLEAVCLRYFNVYGPRQDPGSPYSGVLSIFTDRFQRGLPVTVYGDGEQTRDFISVRDVAEYNGQALTRQDVVVGRYNVCTGHAISLKQVLAIYRELFPNAPPTEFASGRIGDIRHSLGDPALLREMLQFSAQTEFAQGLRELNAG